MGITTPAIWRDAGERAGAAARTGSAVGPYRIVHLLGAGGMEVYRAPSTPASPCDVAIKVLPQIFSADPRCALKPARLLVLLNHPHITAARHAPEESNGVQALVMELVEGDLAQRIARGPIPLAEALPMAGQIAEALEAAHEQGIIHRELEAREHQVRQGRHGQALDFGLAKVLEPIGRSPAMPDELADDVGLERTLGSFWNCGVHVARAGSRQAGGQTRYRAFGVVFYERR